MKRPNLGGMTAVAALVLAIGAGAVGGVMAVSGAAPSPVAPTQQVHSIADEDATVPEPSATPAPVVDESQPAPAPVVHDTASVSDPAPIVEPVAPEGETAQQAADRAKAEADRAQAEADRAAAEANAAEQSKTTAPAPAAPVVEAPVAVVTPEPTPMCKEGDRVLAPYRINADGSKTGGAERECHGGAWVVVKAEHTIPAPPKPKPPADTQDPVQEAEPVSP